jgi:hypothetical protein
VLSSDGRCVVFQSYSNNLDPDDPFGFQDVYLRDRHNGATDVVSVSSAGVLGNGASEMPSVSPNGRFVVYYSEATNLVAGDTNGAEDVFLYDRGDASIAPVICIGDGFHHPCPCGNIGIVGHGCQNSATTGGGTLSALGNATLSADTLKLTTSGELPSALSIVLQGNSAIAPVNYGDGIRCAGGSLKRLYVKNAVNGAITAPQGAELPVSVRSAALGDTITQGTTRVYQVYYRDANAGFCQAPVGGTFNISGGLVVTWSN